MSDFKAKMHQFRLRQSPRPRWGSLQRSPRPASWWGGDCCPCPPLSTLQASTPLFSRTFFPNLGMSASFYCSNIQ